MTRRIAVVGDSGSGKTTLAAELARRLGVPHIELDALMHNPGWVPTPRDEFLARVRAAMAASPAGWVSDGNYRDALREVVLPEAETVVWLDLPLRVSWPRLWARTVRRMATREPLYNDNRELARNLFSAEHPVWWSLRHHRTRVATYDAWMDERWVRLRTPAEVATWLARSPV